MGNLQNKRAPIAPSAYRPCALPRCLQSLPAPSRRHLQPPQARIASPGIVGKPVTIQPPPLNRAASIKPAPAANVFAPLPKAKASQHALPQQHAPRSRQGIVQTIKVFPNLHPGAALPVNRGNVFKLDTVTDQYRLRRLNSHFVSVPNQKYNFVTTTRGELLLHNRYRHPSLAEGQQVLYAGEASFNNGRLDWWSNASGHYQPDGDHAKQAALPMERFYTYQQVLKGEHKKKQAQAAQKELNLTRSKR